MAYSKPSTFKVAGTIPLDVNEELDLYAGKAGMSKTQFVGVLVQFGLKAWIRAYTPEKLLNTDDWQKIIKMMGQEVAQE